MPPNGAWLMLILQGHAHMRRHFVTRVGEGGTCGAAKFQEPCTGATRRGYQPGHAAGDAGQSQSRQSSRQPGGQHGTAAGSAASGPSAQQTRLLNRQCKYAPPLTSSALQRMKQSLICPCGSRSISEFLTCVLAHFQYGY